MRVAARVGAAGRATPWPSRVAAHHSEERTRSGSLRHKGERENGVSLKGQSNQVRLGDGMESRGIERTSLPR
jgi:hypothetical protein